MENVYFQKRTQLCSEMLELCTVILLLGFLKAPHSISSCQVCRVIRLIQQSRVQSSLGQLQGLFYSRLIQNWQTKSLPGKWVRAAQSNVVCVAFKSQRNHQMLHLPSDKRVRCSNLSSIFQEISHFPGHSTHRNFTKKTFLEFSCGVSPTSSMQVFYQGI